MPYLMIIRQITKYSVATKKLLSEYKIILQEIQNPNLTYFRLIKTNFS